MHWAAAVPEEYFLDLVGARACPAGKPHESGIRTGEGHRTDPFEVQRDWSGPAGHYFEEWSLRRGSDVSYSHSGKLIRVWGMQSTSRFTDRVEGLTLEPGTYQLVFIIEGRYMGSADVQVTRGDEAAA